MAPAYRVLAIALVLTGGALYASPAGATDPGNLSVPVECVTTRNPPPGPCPPGSPTLVGTSFDLSTTATGKVYAAGTGQIATLGIQRMAAPIVGIALSNSTGGFWLAGADGGVFALDGAPFYGSAVGLHLNAPIVGIVAPSSTGYWLVAADGGVFAFGSAPFYGSMGGSRLNAPVVGMSGTSGGYLLAAADGGVFTFGDASFDGSMAGLPLDAPIAAVIELPPVSNSYFLAGSDGGIFTFGSGALFESFKGIVSAPVISVQVESPEDYPLAGVPTVVTSNGDMYG